MAENMNPAAEAEKYEVAPMAAESELVEFGARGFNIRADLTERKTTYCSFTAEDNKSKAFLFNISNQTPESVADHIGEVIEVTDIYVEAIQLTRTDDMTGEVTTISVPRTVLITKDGRGFGAVSAGIYGSIKRLISYFGEPSEWDAPLKLKLKQINNGERRLLTFEVIP